MKTYSARFVGETTYPDVYDEMRDAVPGDVMLVARTDYNGEGSEHGPYIAIRCACGHVDLVALQPYAFKSNGASWRLTSREPVNVEPSIVSAIGTERCHYFVHGGQLQMLDDTTRPLA